MTTTSARIEPFRLENSGASVEAIQYERRSGRDASPSGTTLMYPPAQLDNPSAARAVK
jgi:hypothetical protein